MYMISGKVSYSFQPMQLRLFLAKFVSHKFSLPGKMSRGIKSSPGGNYSAIQSENVEITLRCLELGLGSGGFYQPGYQDGAKLRLHMMCRGLDWDPRTRKYLKRHQRDNSIPPDIPPDFNKLVKRVLHDSHSLIKQQSGKSDVEEILPCMLPDRCIANFYTINGRLGLHQDQDESRDSLLRRLPVISFSIGDSAEFLYGDQRDIDKAESVLSESGDVLTFGGKSRHIFHGVTSIIPKTAPHALSEKFKATSWLSQPHFQTALIQLSKIKRKPGLIWTLRMI